MQEAALDNLLQRVDDIKKGISNLITKLEYENESLTWLIIKKNIHIYYLNLFVKNFFGPFPILNFSIIIKII